MQGLSLLLEHFIRHYGIAAIFITMILESACIPLPSELIMTFAGFESWKGNINFTEAVFAGVIGNVVGSLIAYYIGSKGGRPFLRRYGKYILFSEKHFSSAEHWFARYGAITVLLGRILPAIRTFISLPAGIANMRISTFLLFTTIGSLPWVYILTLLGYQFGGHWAAIEQHSSALTYVFAILLIAILIIFWLRNKPHTHIDNNSSQ
ncbi:DedA family protein [Sulfoacidibacillus thermotolerans]|uniref:Alkaline phosphatase n=1 Tax=Sulfoacidibacillus thermotolerans TaxID=1765684 RepID=A0A2U3DCB7_SULT2|nr:DedA family protein [Sulfoacidibacillus thermotolerans]PWI58929.1 alkaline phosphatase [Sulfoacidibacillus thermotolerans]